jgi:hypothetical protein
MCPEYTEIAEAAKADLQEAIMKNFQVLSSVTNLLFANVVSLCFR